MDLVALQKFLYESTSEIYANPEVRIIEEKDGSHTIVCINGSFTLHDNYFGGEPFGGREVIFENNKPVWMMVYYGSVTNRFKKLGSVYSFLKEALRNNTKNMPYRGPKKYKKDEWLYKNELKGDMKSFIGEEKIFYKDKMVYSANYQGGLINNNE
ncbi:hypothetical protein JW796_04085 [Candidatus Dojkabacteria bacterium]|nr:hypothetical protein [Candidatus Dojkabacteria bacterium]